MKRNVLFLNAHTTTEANPEWGYSSTQKESHLVLHPSNLIETKHEFLLVLTNRRSLDQVMYWYIIISELCQLIFLPWHLVTHRIALQRYSQSRRPHSSWPFHDFAWYNSWNSHKPWMELPAGTGLWGRSNWKNAWPVDLWIALLMVNKRFCT